MSDTLSTATIGLNGLLTPENSVFALVDVPTTLTPLMEERGGLLIQEPKGPPRRCLNINGAQS